MDNLELLYHELTHLLLTFLAVGIVFLLLFIKKRNTLKLFLLVLIGAFLGEFLLDSDHLFDYFLAFGLHFRPDYFFSGLMFEKLHKAFVLFHSWEWLFVLGIIIKFTKNISFKYFFLAIWLGLLFHLVYDTYYNHVYFQGYSLIFRFIHNFDQKYISIPI